MHSIYREQPPAKCALCGDDINGDVSVLATKAHRLLLHCACDQAIVAQVLCNTGYGYPRLTRLWRFVVELLKKCWYIFWLAFAIGVGLCTAFLLGYPLYKRIVSDGKMTYCYVDANGVDKQHPYQLHGNTEWHDDRFLGKYETLDSAMKAAERISCKVQ